MAWALAGYLTRHGRHVQHFFSQACYCGVQGALAASGVPSRHFDTWLMTRETCRARLAAAYATADFVIVEGRFESRAADDDAEPIAADSVCDGGVRGGSLEVLCRRLDLPRIVVLDASAAADGCFPARPDAVDGVLLDDVESSAQFARVQTSIEGAWGVPVVGGLMLSARARDQLRRLPPAGTVARELCHELVEGFAQLADPRGLDAIAARPTLPSAATNEIEIRRPSGAQPPVIAVAYDDAFCGYFSDTLETLERLGARVVDFSPLSDEQLPAGVDVVLVGCGRPDRHAAALAANHCLKASLHDFARRGGRIYAEGGGLAYLSRRLSTADGRAYPMVDLLPLAAHRVAPSQPPQAVEFSAAAENWLVPVGKPFRAYRGRAWSFERLEPVESLVGDSHDLIRAGNVVGGSLQLYLATQPELLAGLFRAPRRVPHYVAVGAPT